MELQDILKGLKAKATEAKKITGLNSRHFAFRNWHTTVMQLLKELPASYISQVNDFKALTFENTGFKRGRKFSSSSDNTKFLQDLEASSNILKEIAKTAKEEAVKSRETSSPKPKKPPQPSKKPSGEKSTEKAGPKKPPSAKGTRKPAKKGSSSTRKKKKS